MRKAKERKHELQRVRTRNKIAKKDKQKNIKKVQTNF